MIIEEMVEVNAEEFLYPEDLYSPDDEVDWEYGGIDLYDTSKDLRHRVWLFWLDQADEKTIYCAPLDDLSYVTLLYTVPYPGDVTAITGCFDGSMSPLVGWHQNGNSYLRYYDSAARDFRVIEHIDAYSPKLSYDDKRDYQGIESDVIYFYLWERTLKCEFQRERFTIPRTLFSFDKRLRRIRRAGMARNYRMQVEVEIIGLSPKITVINT